MSESEIWPRSAVFGSVVYTPGGGFGPRTQADVQLVVADAGTIRLCSDDEQLLLLPGEVVCQWPGARERWFFDADRPTAHRWVALRFGADAAAEVAVGAWSRSAPRTRPESSALQALCTAGLALRGDGSAAASAARLRLAAAFLRGFLEAAVPDAADATASRLLPPPLRRMREHIATRSSERMSLADLAAAAHVTPSHLVRLSREHLGTTPVALLWEARVERGLELLRGTGLSIAEIADQTGFADPYHFSRRIKQAVGRPPRELRG